MDNLNNNYSRSICIRKPAVSSTKGLVTANHRIAANAGAKVLAEGGSAMDAAVATSFMLGVCEPWMSGIGGCGHMLVYSADTGAVEAIDFGTISPSSLDPTDFPLCEKAGDSLFNWPGVVDNRNVTGAASICVPTIVRAMDTAHQRHGRMPWKELVLPAAEQADEGLCIDAYASLFIGSTARDIQGNKAASALFLDGDGLPPTIAWTSSNTLKKPMPTLAQTLRHIAVEGAEVMYRGDLAENLVDDVQTLGGYLSLSDLANYQSCVSAATHTEFADYSLHVSPELNAGPTLLSAFSQLGCAGKQRSPSGADLIELVEALHHASDERMATMGDCGDRHGQGCTTHFNVVDSEGNMVVVTQTLLSVFGSKIVSEKTGVLLNNGTLWFDPVPGNPNSIAPSRRPLANMCPVIAVKSGDGQQSSVLGIGAAGGRKIMPAVAQILWRAIVFGESLDDAFHAPRIETSIRDKITADYRFHPECLAALQSRFTTELDERHFYPYSFGCPSAIHRFQGINSGCTEVYSLWGDTVTEEEYSKGLNNAK